MHDPRQPALKADCAVILGGAECLWEDLRKLGPWPGLVSATNDAGWAYPHRIDHWVTLHPEKFALWEPKRDTPGAYVRWSRRTSSHTDRVTEHWGGSSVGLAAKIALVDLETAQVVLAGAPLTESPHFLGGEPWEAASFYRREWQEQLLPRLGRLTERLTSLSGWTREVLGAPDCQIAGCWP